MDKTLALDGLTSLMRTRTLVMGIVNVTPDSFSDGGRFMAGGVPDLDGAVDAAMAMASDGADIIDVGGESTRPGSARVSTDEELSRVIPVIEGIRRRSTIPISIDTYKSSVAKAAAAAGASIINDVSACDMDPDMSAVAARVGCALILMHMKGSPEDMQRDPSYTDVVSEVRDYLLDRARSAEAAGVPHGRIMVDPGIGFGKTVAHNLALINRLDEIASIGYPVVLGVSRKAFIGNVTGTSDPADRADGTLAACVAGIMRGANIIRVHDVKSAIRAAAVTDAVMRA